MVFSLKNIDDAGFGLRDSSKLGNLLNRKSRENHEQAELVNVWGSCGRVFVTTNKGRNLHAFESVPRSKWTPESEGLLLQDQESPIVSVLSSTENPYIIFVVHQDSITQCWEFTQSNFKWVKRNEFQLSNTKRVEVSHVVLHSLVNSFLWCERRSLSNAITCCVCLREVTVSERLGNNTGVSIGPLVVILHGCPSMSMHVIGRGVCLVPNFPEELRNVILFWAFIQRTLKVYMWNHGLVGDVDKVDFKAIIADLVCPWFSSTKRSTSQIVGVSSHPTTNELLVVDNFLELSFFRLQDGDPVLKPLAKLCHDPSSGGDKVSLLFSFGLFAGLVWSSGAISIYDAGSGAQLCRLEDLQGQSVHLWRCFHLVNSVGFWSIGGIWKLQSRTILEISEVIRSLLPSRNFETETTDLPDVPRQSNKLHTKTPVLKERRISHSNSSPDFNGTGTSEHFGIPEFLSNAKPNEHSPMDGEQSMQASESMFCGPLIAANHLMKWNMNHRAAKLALDSIVCSQILSDCWRTDDVPAAFLDLLVGECAQSPAMALVLLWEHPVHREFVCRKLEQYMDETCNKSQITKTCLNELLHPYISEFLLLSKQMKLAIEPSLMEINQSTSLPTNSVDQEVASLLDAFDVGLLDVTSLERLSMLSYQHPQKILEHVAEYLKIDSEHEDLRSSEWEPRWRKIYRLEWKKHQWQRNRFALKEPFNAILSILLRLFHDSKSEFLMRSVEKGMNLVHLEKSDETAEEHITQSVLDCLPVLHTIHANSESVEVHARLCYSAGQERQALHLLLRNRMWKEAVDFVSCCGKNSESRALLFVILIKGLQRGRAPSENLVNALSLKPAGFNIHELLGIMKDQAPVAKEPFMKGAGQTTLGDIRPFLNTLFSSQSVT